MELILIQKAARKLYIRNDLIQPICAISALD